MLRIICWERGYGGTKSGHERLVELCNGYTGSSYYSVDLKISTKRLSTIKQY